MEIIKLENLAKVIRQAHETKKKKEKKKLYIYMHDGRGRAVCFESLRRNEKENLGKGIRLFYN